MTEADLEKYNSCNQKFSRYFIPIQWCYSLLFEARMSGKIGADLMLNEIIKVGDCGRETKRQKDRETERQRDKFNFQHISVFRDGLAQLSNFDWVPIPLVYPQVVFLAVRSYFFLCLIARQSVLIDGSKPEQESMVRFFNTRIP